MKFAATVPELPSVTVTSPTETLGSASSFVIVPTPWLSPSVPWTAFVRLTRKVSVSSFSVSPFTSTVTGREVWPAAKVTVPLPA